MGVVAALVTPEAALEDVFAPVGETEERRSTTFPLTTVSSSGKATVGRLEVLLPLPAHCGVGDDAVPAVVE